MTDIHAYEKPSLTTDMVMLRVARQTTDSNKKDKLHLEILLIRRKNDPQKGFYSLPGGFVAVNEDIETCLMAKLKEKTGVEGKFYYEQLYTNGKLRRDPRGRVISVSYIGLVNDETYNKKGTWYPLENVMAKGFQMAFDHKIIINQAIERLANKLEYTDVAFNLLTSEFIISDLQQVFELILNKELVGPNFRRKISQWIEPTGNKTEGQAYRPTEIFRLKK